MLMCSGFYLQHDVKERIVIRVRPEAGQVCVCVFLPGGLNSAQLDALVITGSILKKENTNESRTIQQSTFIL